jgi:hypothetical protein
MNKDERAQLLREIDNLVDDFKMLRVVAVSGRIRTDRQRNVSRMPTLKDEDFFLRLRDGRHPTAALNSYGICEVETLTQPPADTKEAPSLLFPKTGQPLLIIKPELITLKSAHVSLHRIFISGTNCDSVKAAFDRASEWTKRRFKLISKAIFPKRLVSFGAYCWLDVVLEIAQQSDDATMIKPIWLKEYKRVGDVVYDGVITKGDEPEEKYCEVELKPFLRDSELALDWLRRWVEDSQLPPKPATEVSAKKSDKKKGGRRRAKLTKEERKVKELWSSGNFKNHNDIDEHLGLDWGTTAKTLNRLIQRERRKKVTE